MPDRVDRAGLQVASVLAAFIEDEALPGTGIDPLVFWLRAADLFALFTPRNRELLAIRNAMQTQIDEWHQARHGRRHDPRAYRSFLRAISYLQPEPPPFGIDPAGVDPEVAAIAGPQLVVPILNARFLLNAANARWGSLYDALYGTDALIPGSAPMGYERGRGARVIAYAKAFLDETIPLVDGSHAKAGGYRIVNGRLDPALADPSCLVGYRGDPSAPSTLLFRHNGLHIELRIDRAHPVGAGDWAGIADIQLESAVTTIADLEDSVAAVDAEDKVAGYRNWLGLMDGTLEAEFEKDGRILTRRLAEDRRYVAAGGGELVLKGRSLLFVRNVGHLMTTSALLLPDGSEAPEGILDGILTALIGKRDLEGLGRFRNSPAGSIYIVKPKMHGPDEAEFANDLFDEIENLLGLDRHSLKIGLMDEERRTSANLAACIHRLRHRIVFINTGFLDRTGDEIHSSMEAGAMVPKAAMRSSRWIQAYEDRNVRIGLACGFAGKAQIGKGMWAAPDRMGAMLEEKIGHPASGASTAWVPSPTAATLHALHYHAVDVQARQAELEGEGEGEVAAENPPSLADLLAIPLAGRRNWRPDEVRRELENNAQGILGYVVRWIDFGIGCSKVPDIDDVALMEDRATLRISSQHIANWLRHGVATAREVDAALLAMAAKVDGQNAHDPSYVPMTADPRTSIALTAARALVFEGRDQPNGYTEPLLHRFRRLRKERLAGDVADG
jgi:malate synthase